MEHETASGVGVAGEAGIGPATGPPGGGQGRGDRGHAGSGQGRSTSGRSGRGRWIAWAVALVLAAGAGGYALAAAVAPWGTYQGFPIVRLVVDGRVLTPDVPAVNLNGRTMVPLRAIAEALGVPVTWDDATKTAIVGSSEVSMAPSQVALSLDPALASRRPEIQAAVDDLYGKVAADLGFPEAAPAEAHVFASREAYGAFLKGALGEGETTDRMAQYSCGVASDEFGVAVLVDEEDCGDYRLTVAHEFSHRVLAGRGALFPAWFDEGLAMEEEFRVVYGGEGHPLANRILGQNLEAVAEEAASGHLRGFAATEEDIIDTIDSYPAEQEGQVAIHLLLGHGGIASLRAVLRDAPAKGLATAFQDAWGLAPDGIERFVLFNLSNVQGAGRADVRIRFAGSGEAVAFDAGETSAAGRRYEAGEATFTFREGATPNSSLSATTLGWTLDPPLEGEAVVYVVPGEHPLYDGREVAQEAIVLVHGRRAYYFSGLTLFFADGTSQDIDGTILPDGTEVLEVESGELAG